MRKEYVITQEELQERGLNLSEYSLDEAIIPAIIGQGLDITISRACELGDIKSSRALEEYISTDDEDRSSEDKVEAFKKAQYRVIYGLIFMAQTDPIDQYVDSPLVFELGLKINSMQKGIYYGIK